MVGGVVAIVRVVFALGVDVARAEWLGRPQLGVEPMAPNAAGVVGQQMQRDTRDIAGRGDLVDVVVGWDQREELAALDLVVRLHLDALVGEGVDVLVLGALVEANQTPGEMVVDRRRLARRHDEREQAERAVLRAVQGPLSDPLAHAALWCIGHVLGGKPVGVFHERSEGDFDALDRLLNGATSCNLGLDLRDEVAHHGRIEDELGAVVVGMEEMLGIAHGGQRTGIPLHRGGLGGARAWEVGCGWCEEARVVCAVKAEAHPIPVQNSVHLRVVDHAAITGVRDAVAMTQDINSMLLDMPPDTTIKVERQLRERIRGAAQGKSMTINQFLETLMKDYERRDRMARAAEAMRSASPEVMAAYREEMKIWDRALMDGLDGW